VFSSEAEWDWILKLNLTSVIHCTRLFVPAMARGTEECYVVNTASIYGLAKGQGPYGEWVPQPPVAPPLGDGAGASGRGL
jgi:NAD(P)-dependent dehydrogenase (short-subunit alcohol dehydrogenase family)